MKSLPQPAPIGEEDRLPGLDGSAGIDEAVALMVRLAVGARFDRVGAVAHEHLMTGGKRMRARLALAAADAVGVERRTAAPWAAACELLHQASLVHDDVQDGDRIRRGHATVWARHGLAGAINAGDLLLMLPWLAIAELSATDGVRWQLSRACAAAAEQTVRGQAADLDLLHSERLERHDWENAARGKSGALLALPVEGAALLAGLAGESARAVAEPFGRLGVLYQATDDLVDLYGDKGRGAPGNDLREGKVSLLVVEHLRLHPDDRIELLELLALPREATPDDAVRRWIHRFDERGTVAACRAYIAALAAEVTDDPHLRAVPDLRAIACTLVVRVTGVLR